LKFNRLRLSGFKSFVDPSELFIEPGLTGIIGPNGCGKSNLLEAIRWVMGENRPTSMRGSGMDDVIFAGSAGRPMRNHAEAVLIIDNSDRTAPAPYNDFDAVEISRRIEREMGSTYRINGREVRQRDVQIFFADASTGSQSPALVRQGQIAVLINQKPLQRRAILEEAAGIAGLHQRRHEAELRLKAAEANLLRLDDVIAEIETQLQGLKRQARQASRYRNLSGHIRKAEALVFLLRWQAAEAAESATAHALREVSIVVAERTQNAAAVSTEQAKAANALPPLREAETVKTAALQRLLHERDALDSEEARAREEAQRVRQRIGQAEADFARERTLEGDAAGALAALERERTALQDAQTRAADEAAETNRRAATLAAQLAERESTLERLTAGLAQLTVTRHGDATPPRVHETRRALEALAAETGDQDALVTAIMAIEQARGRLDEAHTAEAAAREPVDAAEREMQRFTAEISVLNKLLFAGRSERWPPLIDAVRVQPGYEAALAAALGESLEASLENEAPQHWRNLGGMDTPSLPQGATPLAKFVEAPPALTRRLAQTGVVEITMGIALQAKLKPGQRLVSKRGDLWRWDGFCASADAPSQAALRLEQRNRLIEVERGLAALQADHAGASKTLAAARKDAAAAAEDLLVAEQALREREAALMAMQASAAKAARAAAGEADAAVELLKREAIRGGERLAGMVADVERWSARREASRRQMDELTARIARMRDELVALEAAPARVAERRAALASAIDAAEIARKQAADARAEAETRLADADKRAKAADAVLAEAREERAGASARADAAAARLTELKARIRDELDCVPNELTERAELKAGAELPPLEDAEERVEKLKREREQLGGVNLRAEEEAAEFEQRLQTLTADRADLSGAIERLRRGIQSLNREGRERLIESFAKVNANFERLFKELFQGGEARLTFTESDDPLEAGLEILAKPPGKKLTTLSLLSGGEQALTAIALILAVFLVNPAPICVLDEVDAPLDDANVDRFCRMLEEMTRLTDTRFLVITHHPLTMSRMDRLFGVTMAERGVSQLVSVSLAEAERVVAAE
jgi:chromosome segregation protein